MILFGVLSALAPTRLLSAACAAVAQALLLRILCRMARWFGAADAALAATGGEGAARKRLANNVCFYWTIITWNAFPLIAALEAGPIAWRPGPGVATAAWCVLFCDVLVQHPFRNHSRLGRCAADFLSKAVWSSSLADASMGAILARRVAVRGGLR